MTIGEAITGVTQNFLVDEFLDNALFALLIAATFVPILEETVFRLFVTSFDPFKIALSFFCALFLFFGSFSFLTIALGGLCVFIFIRATRHISLDKKRQWWNNHFGTIFYASMLFFGLYHIINWDISLFDVSTLLALPLLTFPQIIAGFILGYARVALGFPYAVALHALGNFLIGSVAFLLLS